MWSDDWFYELDPSEKLMWVFLLTNPRNNVAGVYEASISWIGVHTGFEKNVVELIIKRFEKENKISRHENWIYIINHHKHQSESPKIEQGVHRILSKISPEVLSKLISPYHMDTLCIRYPTLLNLTLLNSTKPNLTKPNVNNEDEDKSSGVLIAEIIQLFSEVNPSYQRFFSNKTQRGSVERMLETHGFETLEKVIGILPETNKLKYVPTITTPIQLEDKWASLEANLKKLKSETTKLVKVAKL